MLGGGLSNTSVRVADSRKAWVVRIDGLDHTRLGLSRDAEWRALEMAASRGLAPKPVFRNPDLGALVCEYHSSVSVPLNIAGVARLLRAIHALPPIKFRLDPLQRARCYLQGPGARVLPAELVEACQALTPSKTVLCHNDLLQANRLYSKGRLLAIDWEYAAMGDPLFDLAAVIEGDRYTNSQALALLTEWMQTEPTREALERLALQRVIYQHLARLWEGAATRLRG
ncbi:MAG: choline/ethanolamine kinase family protein [Pseudomonadota bacterium]